MKNTKLKFNKVKEFDFREGPYKIIYKKLGKASTGECEQPPFKYFKKSSKMYIDPNLDEKEFLKTVLDEAFHANLWEIDNEIVDQISTNIGEFLWRLGFRLKK